MSEENAEVVEAQEEPIITGSTEPQPEVVDEAPTETTEDDTAAPKPTRAEKRIGELIGKNHAISEDRDYWRNKALEKTEPQPEPIEEAQPPVRPKLADFDHDVEAYAEALGDFTERSIQYAADKKVQEIESKTVKAQESNTQAQAQEQRQTRFIEQSTEFAAENPDYYDIVGNPTLSISQAMTDALMDESVIQNGAAVTYHLGLHPEIAARIANKPPAAAQAELVRIEANLSKTVPEVKTSSAPQPPNPIQSTRATSTSVLPTDPKSDKMTTEEWAAARRKQTRG